MFCTKLQKREYVCKHKWVYWNTSPCVKTCAVLVSRVGRVCEREMINGNPHNYHHNYIFDIHIWYFVYFSNMFAAIVIPYWETFRGELWKATIYKFNCSNIILTSSLWCRGNVTRSPPCLDYRFLDKIWTILYESNSYLFIK